MHDRDLQIGLSPPSWKSHFPFILSVFGLKKIFWNFFGPGPPLLGLFSKLPPKKTTQNWPMDGHLCTTAASFWHKSVNPPQKHCFSTKNRPKTARVANFMVKMVFFHRPKCAPQRSPKNATDPLFCKNGIKLSNWGFVLVLFFFKPL